jgi:tetratricopeptide (TPR) repeat protein
VNADTAAPRQRRRQARLVLFCLALSCCFFAALTLAFASRAAAAGPAKMQTGKFEEPLLNLAPDRAIRLYCAPLNQSLACADRVTAARIMRMIALAFHLDENDTAAAQAALLALKLNPDDKYCCFQSAEYLFRDGRRQESEELLKGLCRSADPYVALRARAFLDLQQGRFHQALTAFEQYVQGNPDDERALLKLSYLYLVYEDFPQLAALERKLALRSCSEYFKEIHLGKSDEAENKLKSAEAHYRAAGRLLGQDPLWHYQLALMFMKKERIKEADQEYKQCFTCRRLISLAYSNWAVMEAFFGSTARAEDCLAYASRLRPRSYDLLFAHGIVEEKAGRLEKAGQEFEAAIAVNPYSGSPYIHLLQLSRARPAGPAERLELCRAWCRNCPHSAIAAAELGNALRESGNDDQALESYLQAESLVKGRVPSGFRLNFCVIHAYVAGIYYKRKDLKNALAQAGIFNALRPDLPSTAGVAMRPARIDLSKLKDGAKKAAEHALLADALYECRRLKEAEDEYRLAEKEDPGQITYHSCLLKVLLDKKDYAAAAREDAAVSQHVIMHIPEVIESVQKEKKAPGLP